MEEGIRNTHPDIEVLPRHTQLRFVVADVFVRAVSGEDIRDRCATGCCFEASSRGDKIVGGNTAIAPAANAQLIRISDAASYGIIDRSEVIFDIPVSPVGVNAERVFLAAAG